MGSKGVKRGRYLLRERLSKRRHTNSKKIEEGKNQYETDRQEDENPCEVEIGRTLLLSSSCTFLSSTPFSARKQNALLFVWQSFPIHRERTGF